MLINKAFAYHKPSAESLSKVNSLRFSFSELQRQLMDVCPASRERSVALTELETAAMWAIKSIVSNDPESVVG